MALASEDFSKCSLAEVVSLVVENRAWNKELRLSAKVLVSSRLAKQISADEYATARRFANENEAECKRRGIILLNEIRIRG